MLQRRRSSRLLGDCRRLFSVLGGSLKSPFGGGRLERWKGARAVLPLPLPAAGALLVPSTGVLKRLLLAWLLCLASVCLRLSVLFPLSALDGVGDPEDFLAAAIAREVLLAAQTTGWYARVVSRRIW